MKTTPHTPRRDFLKLASLASASAFVPSLALPAAASTHTCAHPSFPSVDPRWQRTWDAALAVLAGNIHTMPRYTPPTLVEGAVYPGIWLECAPQEGLVYGTLDQYITPASAEDAPLKVARNNHMAFFAQQKPDGQLPASIKLADPPRPTTATARSRWSSPSPPPHGISSSSPTTTSSSSPPTTPAPAGTPGSANIATPARPASSKASAPTTPATTTPPAGPESPTAAPTPTPASARPCPPCRASAPTSPPPSTAAAWPSPTWPPPSAKATKPPAGTTTQKKSDPHHHQALQPRRRRLLRPRRPEQIRPRPRRPHLPRPRRARPPPLRRPRQSHLRRHLDQADPQPQSLLGALPTHLHRHGRPHLRPPHPPQLLGRSIPSPHRPPSPALDALLRQTSRAQPPHAAMDRSHQPPHRVPPTDGPPNRRLHPG